MPSLHHEPSDISLSESSQASQLFVHEGKPLRQLKWDETNHFSIMTQLEGRYVKCGFREDDDEDDTRCDWYGRDLAQTARVLFIDSVIPSVIPYCIVNGIITYVVYELKQRKVIDVTSNPSGHKYLAVIMSFLLVTRVKIIYDRYMQNAKSLTNLNKACRELGQWTVAFTAADKSQRAAQWRHDVAYSAILMLRVTVAVLEFQANPEQMPWELPEMDQNVQQGIQENLFVSIFKLNVNSDDENEEGGTNRQRSQQSLLAHTTDDQRTKLEEACRAPVVLAFNCRQEILKQRDGTWLDRHKVWYHPCNEEMRLLDLVGDFSNDFHNLRQLIVTPMPFPLVNMAKIFLFLWVFTIPFSLCHFTFKGGVTVPVTIIFLITFGFMGLEYVSMELSDPFGEDVSMPAV